MKKKKLNDTQTSSAKAKFNKIIYFDKETIRNILQEYNKGTKSTVNSSKESANFNSQLETSADIQLKIKIPLLLRIKFFFTSKISSTYISQFDSVTTITSTEISDFEKIKGNFIPFESVSVSDIENSSTFFRVAGNYSRILKGGVKNVDAKEFKNVMEGYDGYDHYKISGDKYVRFNNSAFVSNYKRNDLLNSKLELYCIFVGKFPESSFNFIEQIFRMSGQSNSGNKTLDKLYPSLSSDDRDSREPKISVNKEEKIINLFDVVYASICPGAADENI